MWKLLALSAAAFLALSGCKGACRQLSEKQCECSQTSSERTSCLTLVSSKEASVTLTADDEATCEALLPKCDCHTITTSEGKARCGMARPLPESDAGL